MVGASAGGVEALRAFVRGLDAEFAAAVCVVLHIPRSGVSALPQILDRCGPLPVRAAADGAALVPGMIYVAPPDVHLLVDDGRVRLSRGPAENGHRPAIDPLFRSAARGWGAAAIGVVLSGSRDDGADGLAAIARCGGAALVQDPVEAQYPSMPAHAAQRVGEQSGALEGALWMALRSLEEKAALGREMAGSAAGRDSGAIAARYSEMSREAEHAGQLIRKLIEQIDEFDGSAALDETR